MIGATKREREIWEGGRAREDVARDCGGVAGVGDLAVVGVADAAGEEEECGARVCEAGKGEGGGVEGVIDVVAVDGEGPVAGGVGDSNGG